MILLMLAHGSAGAASISAVPDHASGLYHDGDPITWTVTVSGTTTETTLSYVVLKNLKTVLPAGLGYSLSNTMTTTIVGGLATVTYNPSATDRECTLMLAAALGTVSSANPLKIDTFTAGHNVLSGVAINPDQIEPGTACPSDFDAFWTDPTTGRIPTYTNLTTYPLNPTLSAVTQVSGVSYQTFTLDNPLNQNGFGLTVANSLIYGQMAYPTTGGRYPGLLYFEHAGITDIQHEGGFGNNVTSMANKGFIALNINPYSVSVDGTQGQTGYTVESWGDKWDKDENDFLRMFISCYRTAQYLKSMKYDASTNPTGKWDGNTIVLYGASQGGLQALFVAAFLPGVTAVVIDIPAGCNQKPTGDQVSGWPLFGQYTTTYYAHPSTAGQVGLYFDGANFAPRATAPMLVGLGMIDNVAYATNVYAAISHAGGPMVVLPALKYGHAADPSWTTRSNEWLTSIGAGQGVPAIHALSVVGGSGSGDVQVGKSVSISAAAPALGTVFDAWVGDITNVANPALANASLTMPAMDITVTASYRELPPLVQFSTMSQIVSESASAVTIMVQSSWPSSQTITVPFVVTGSAANPADYTLSANSLTIAPGSTTASLTVTLINDAVAGPNQTINFAMSTPNNATTGTITSHSITIMDAGVPPVAVSGPLTVQAESSGGGCGAGSAVGFLGVVMMGTLMRLRRRR